LVASYAVENVVRSKSQAGELVVQRSDLRANPSHRVDRHQPASARGGGLNDREQNAVTRASGQRLRLEDGETGQRQLHHVGDIAGGEIDLVDPVVGRDTAAVRDSVNHFRHSGWRSRAGSAGQDEDQAREQEKLCDVFGEGCADFRAQRWRLIESHKEKPRLQLLHPF